MITARQILAATAFMAIAGLSHAQTQAEMPQPAAGTATSTDPLVQKRAADKEASTEYKAQKKVAKKNYKHEKKMAKTEMKGEKSAAEAESKAKLNAEPIVTPKP